MAAPKAGAEAFALVSYFEKQYKTKYGIKPTVNRYSARWFFESTHMPPEEMRSLLDYYLTTESRARHSLEWFQYNYEKLLEAKAVYDRDVEFRRARAEESRLRTEKWRKRIAERTEGS